MIEAGVERRWQRLAAGNQSAPPPSVTRAVVLFLVCLGLDHLLDNLLNVANLDEDVFGFEVGMDDAAFAMEVVKAQEDLLGDLFDERHGNSTVVPLLDQAEQVLAEDFENHADMGAVGTFVLKRIEKTDDMFPARMVGFGLDDLIEELDLVDGGLGVMGS